METTKNKEEFIRRREIEKVNPSYNLGLKEIEFLSPYWFHWIFKLSLSSSRTCENGVKPRKGVPSNLHDLWLFMEQSMIRGCDV